MQKSAPLSLLLLAFAASACTLIQDGRLGDPVEGCEIEGAACRTLDDLPGECRQGLCVAIDECAGGGCPCEGDDCERPNGPGVTSFTVEPGLTSPPNVEFRFASTVVTASFECSLDGEPFVECFSPKMYAGLSDGVHVFRVRAVGENGQREAPPLVHEWTVDSTVLDTFFTTSPPETTGRNVSFAFDGTLAASFECRLAPNETSFAPCTSPKAYTNLTQRAEGYTFEVRAVDADGNPDATPAAHAFMVDATPPAITISGTPASGDPTDRWDVDFTFTANEPVTQYYCKVDEEPFFACSAHYTRVGFRPGQHVLSVKAVDQYGNENALPVQTFWIVEPRLVQDIREIQTGAIAGGTIVTIDDAAPASAGGTFDQRRTRITFVDEARDLYWIQQGDGSYNIWNMTGPNPDYRGLRVYPYNDIPSTSDVGKTPVITGVVEHAAGGERLLVDAEFQIYEGYAFPFWSLYLDRDATLARRAEYTGVLISMAGEVLSGSGGCAGAGVHVEACWAMTGSRVICVDDPDELLPPPSYQDYTAWVSFEAIPMRTPTGVVLRVTEAWTDMGEDACL